MSKQALFDQVISVIREQFSSQDFIPLHEPRFIGNEKQYLNECIDSTFVSSVGPFVDRFESTIAHLTGTKHGVAVVNGTAALQVALQVVGVQPDEEVITQALTFVATANAIAYRQAKPVFIDVDLDTMGLSPKSLLAFLEKHAELRSNGAFNLLTGKRIGAVVVMHTFGFPAHVLELSEICQKWKIPLVEDAAESLGSTINGQQTGSFGTVGIFSFNGNKIVTSGGGGAIVTNDSSLAKKAKHLTTTAKVPHAYDYEHDELGYNFRMPNINAALACAQLEKLPYFLEQKQRLAQKYKVQFDQLGIKLRWSLPNTRPNYWLLCLEFADRATRNDFLDYAIESNVMCRPIWKLLIDLPMYQDCYHDGLANSRFLEDRIVNIPSSVQL